MNILIAPNAFKNSIDANDAARAIKEGLLQSKLKCTCECFPVADGGDGTAALLLEKLNGTIVHAKVHDPLGRKISSSFGMIDNANTAVIELADASGLRLLKAEEYDPIETSTFGTGEMILHALDKGAKKLVLGIGGSATVDGGTGILKALGMRFFNAEENELQNLPEDLMHLAAVDTSNIDERIFSTEIIVLCDVQNFLLGEKGAAKIFGPQKGATPDEVKALEARLTKWWDVTLRQEAKDMSVIKHGGAAGGVAAGLTTYLNAKLVNGIDYFLQLTNFDRALQNANLVITGEGSIDEQTLEGKGPFGVAQKAKEKNLPVIALGGKIPLHISDSLEKYFDVILPINNEILSPAIFQEAKENLIRTAMQLGNILAINPGSVIDIDL
jgi:glycerate kinase